MSHAPSFAGVLGYRRKRWNSLGMQARAVVVRDGVLRVVGKDGDEQERVALAGAQVELKRGMVEVVAGEDRFFLFGYPQVNKVPDEVVARVVEEQPDGVIGYDPAKVFKGPFEASAALHEALLAHGAAPQN